MKLEQVVFVLFCCLFLAVAVSVFCVDLFRRRNQLAESLTLTNTHIYLHGNWISSITLAKRYQLINLLRQMIY